MRCRVLIDDCIEIGPEASSVHGWCHSEHCRDAVTADEAAPPQGSDLSDRHTVASQNERLTMVEPTHDVTAVIPQLPLADVLGHGYKRSTGCYGGLFIPPIRPAVPMALRYEMSSE
jgi:hypothetical protein